jgi:hypothetical protein
MYEKKGKREYNWKIPDLYRQRMKKYVTPHDTRWDVANRYFAVVTSSTKPDSLVTNVITVSILIQDKC